jgi:hypothetical protein
MTTDDSGWTSVARLATRQLGLVTTGQLEHLGIASWKANRWARSGHLSRIGHGVYAIHGMPASWEQSALAACLAIGDASVLSHATAAVAWKLAMHTDERLHLTVPHDVGGARARAGLVVHRSRSLPPAERTRVGRLPVTTVARTILDLAPSLPPESLARVVDDALSRRTVTPERLRQAICRHAQRRRPGTKRLWTAIEPWLGGLPLESVAEASFLRAMNAAGLPEPVVQHVIADDETLARVDFAWPDMMVVLEVDGFRWHANPASHARDSLRANKLAAMGWTVLRATPAELESALPALLSAIRRHLAPPA